MNNILDSSIYSCSGCGACNAVCPVNAISIQLDDRGFYHADIDSNKCIECGLCKKVCTRYDENIVGVDIRNSSLLALQSQNENIVKTSSSGGIAFELAKEALKENKKVVGVYYDLESDRAKHIIVETEEQLSLLSGSKYIQSNPTVFKDVIQDAKTNQTEYVVFGTPCQIASLSKVTDLSNIRAQFLLVEIFCHGVPTYSLWNHECEKVKDKWNVSKFDDVQFRYKKDDWHSYCLKIQAGNKTYYGKRETSLFWQVFFENILLNDSCYECRARKEISSADLRLGDYWGSHFEHRSDGVSAVFVCTDKGKQAIESLSVTSFDATSTEEMLKAQNMQGYTQKELHDASMKVLSEEGILPAVSYYRKKLGMKSTLKRYILILSSLIPGRYRSRLRKRHSSKVLQK